MEYGSSLDKLDNVIIPLIAHFHIWNEGIRNNTLFYGYFIYRETANFIRTLVYSELFLS